MGRTLELHTDNDEVFTSVTVMTKRAQFKGPLVSLVPLENARNDLFLQPKTKPAIRKISHF